MRIEDSARKRGRIHGFPPASTPVAHTLILGSMPGAASLLAQRYYAHPQNQFWRILGETLGTAADADYASHLKALTRSGIALWDVLDSCVRRGSLDSNIVSGSQQVNDFEAFFDAHPHIGRILFNGAKAEACFRKLVAASLSQRKLVLMRLPSTSPAHASMGYCEKLAVWREALLSSRTT